MRIFRRLRTTLRVRAVTEPAILRERRLTGRNRLGGGGTGFFIFFPSALPPGFCALRVVMPARANANPNMAVDDTRFMIPALLVITCGLKVLVIVQNASSERIDERPVVARPDGGRLRGRSDRRFCHSRGSSAIHVRYLRDCGWILRSRDARPRAHRAARPAKRRRTTDRARPKVAARRRRPDLGRERTTPAGGDRRRCRRGPRRARRAPPSMPRAPPI